MKDQLIDKIEAELKLPIEHERQVVYILVEIRKLMDRDNIPETEFEQLRVFCNWPVHADLSNQVVRPQLGFLDKIIGPLMEGKLTPEQIERSQKFLSLENARLELLNLIRRVRRNQSLQHVFSPVWWTSFLRQYVKVVSDCPLVFKGKNLQIKSLKSLTIVGSEITGPGGERYEFVFVIKWIFEFVNGVKTILPMELGVEKDHGFRFGREGRHFRTTPPLPPPKS
jgi:hypothetical protein